MEAVCGLVTWPFPLLLVFLMVARTQIGVCMCHTFLAVKTCFCCFLHFSFLLCVGFFPVLICTGKSTVNWHWLFPFDGPVRKLRQSNVVVELVKRQPSVGLLLLAVVELLLRLLLLLWLLHDLGSLDEDDSS